MTATRSQNAARFRSPKRVSVTLPWTAYRNLQDRCDEEGRSLSNLAAFLIESSLESSGDGQHGPPLDSHQANGNRAATANTWPQAPRISL